MLRSGKWLSMCTKCFLWWKIWIWNSISIILTLEALQIMTVLPFWLYLPKQNTIFLAWWLQNNHYFRVTIILLYIALPHSKPKSQMTLKWKVWPSEPQRSSHRCDSLKGRIVCTTPPLLVPGGRAIRPFRGEPDSSGNQWRRTLHSAQCSRTWRQSMAVM